MSPRVTKSEALKRTLARFALPLYVLTTALSGVQFATPPTAFAADTLFTDGFGTGGTDTTFNEAPVWTEDEAGAEKRAFGSGNDSVSPEGGRFAVLFGNNGTLCTTVDATGYSNVKLTYYWRGDTDAGNASDNAIVEVKPAAGNGCGNNSGWTPLADHDLTNDSTWTSQGALTNAVMNNNIFLLRYRTSTNDNDEHLRIDGVNVVGDVMPPQCNGQSATIYVNGSNVIVGGPMNGLSYNGILVGTSGVDVIAGTSGIDYIDGMGGNDTICGRANSDILNGNTGDDDIFGEDGSDSIHGGAGNDDISGGNDNDFLYGGSGVDPINGDAGNDACNGGTPGGELNISCNNNNVGGITIEKNALPNNAANFNFTGAWSFTRDDDSDPTLPNTWIAARPSTGGTYEFTEGEYSDWRVTGLSCTGGGADITTNVGARNVSIGLDDGEDVYCTFTNTQLGKLNVIKVANGDDEDGTVFDFTSPQASEVAPFSIDTFGPNQYGVFVLPGSYSVNESSLPANWSMTENLCQNVTVNAGAQTDCVITNQYTVSSSSSSSSSSSGFDGDVTLEFGDAYCAADESTTMPRLLSIPYTLHNLGANATNAGITDLTAHTSLTFVNSTNIDCPGANHDTCTAGPLAAGGSITGLIRFLVPDGAGNGQFQIYGMGQGGNHPNTREYVCGVPLSSSSSSSTSSSSSSTSSSSSSSSSSTSSSSSSESGQPVLEMSKSIHVVNSLTQFVTYAVTVSNTGTATEPAFVLYDKDFGSQDFVDYAGPLTNCDLSVDFISCDPASLAPGNYVTQYFTFSYADTPCEEGLINAASATFNGGENVSGASFTGPRPGCSASSSSSSTSSSSSSSSSSSMSSSSFSSCGYTIDGNSTWGISQNCSNETGQICSPKFMAGMSRPNDFTAMATFTVPPAHCSSIRVKLFVDGVEEATSPWLSYAGASEDLPSSWSHDLGSLTGETEHSIWLEAEGIEGGCNTGYLASWGGTLSIDTETQSCSSSSSSSYSSSSSSSSSWCDDEEENCSSSSSSSSSSCDVEEENCGSSSSSSSACNEESQSCSSSSSSEPSGPLEISFDTEAGNYRGHETDRAGANIDFLSKFYGFDSDIAPFGFGGSSDTPLSDKELDYICALRRAGFQNTFTFLPYFAQGIAEELNRDPFFIQELLQDPQLCDKNLAALRSSKKVLAKTNVSVPMNAEGFLVSTNEFWNKCFQGKEVLGLDFHKITVQDARGLDKEISCDNYMLKASDGKGGPERWLFGGTNLLSFEFLFYRDEMRYVLPDGYSISLADDVL